MRVRGGSWGAGAATLALVCVGSAGAAVPARAQSGQCTAGSAPALPVAAPGRPWTQALLDPESVWPLTDGAGVTVAVVDSGVDHGNPLLSAPGQVVDGRDVTNAGWGSSALYDCVDHGTLVAGIIGGRQQAGSGFSGMAPGARLLSIRVSDSDSHTSPRALADGIREAVNSRASVINVSLTVQAPDSDLAKAVQYALDRDVVVVAAAGDDNDPTHGNPKEYPASFPGVLAVGAIDRNGQRSGFSGTGTPVSVAAPGDAITAPAAGGRGTTTMLTGQHGTGFAAPLVAGTAALVRAYHPELTAAQVVHRIEATAVRPPGAVPDPAFGWGVVDPRAAVTAVLPNESGGAPLSSGPRTLALAAQRAPDDGNGQRPALVVSAVCAVCVLGIVAAGVFLPLGRRRGWRPGRWNPAG